MSAGTGTAPVTVDQRVQQFLRERAGLLKPESIRRYRLAARYISAVDGQRAVNEVTANPSFLESYPQRRREWAATSNAVVSDAEIEVELTVYLQAVFDGLDVEQAAAAMGFAGSTLYKWQGNGFLVPSITLPQIEPLRHRSSSGHRRRRSGLYSQADIELGRALRRLEDSGLKSQWFGQAMTELRQGHEVHYDKGGRALEARSNGVWYRVWPPEASRTANERPLPANVLDWTLDELWAEFEASAAFKAKSTDRQNALKRWMRNYWLPAFTGKHIRDITKLTVEAELTRLADDDVRVNSRDTLVQLRNELLHVLKFKGVRLVKVRIPEIAPKAPPAREQDEQQHHLRRLRQIQQLYRHLKELETIDDPVARKAAGWGLGAWPWPLGELVLAHVSPALRTREALALRCEQFGQDTIELGDKWVSRNIGGTEMGDLSSNAQRRIPAGRRLRESVLSTWAKGKAKQAPIFAKPGSKKPYRRDFLLRNALKPIAEKLAQNLGEDWASWQWVSLQAIRDEGIYWLSKELQGRFPDKWTAAIAQLLGEKRRGPDIQIAELAPIIDELQSCVVEGKMPAIAEPRAVAAPAVEAVVDARRGTKTDELKEAMAIHGHGSLKAMIKYTGNFNRHISQPTVRKALRGEWPVQTGPSKVLNWYITDAREKAAAARRTEHAPSSKAEVAMFVSRLVAAKERTGDSYKKMTDWLVSWLQDNGHDRRLVQSTLERWIRERRPPEADEHRAACEAYIKDSQLKSTAARA